MNHRRSERVASALQEELSRRLLTEVKDPRIGVISITGVSVNPDLTVARIRYLPLGGQGNRAEIQAGLNEAARRLRGPIGRALGTRTTPELRFEIDKNIEYAAHMEEVMRNLPKGADEGAGAPEGADGAPTSGGEGGSDPAEGAAPERGGASDA